MFQILKKGKVYIAYNYHVFMFSASVRGIFLSKFFHSFLKFFDRQKLRFTRYFSY